MYNYNYTYVYMLHALRMRVACGVHMRALAVRSSHVVFCLYTYKVSQEALQLVTISYKGDSL
jgi:hypothetical protein